MKQITKDKIISHLSLVMERVIERRCVKEPFNVREIIQRNPFGANLVPIEIWKGAKFERSFVTTLGQGIFEQLARIIAEGAGAKAENQYSSRIKICTWKIEKIDSIIASQRNKKIKPNWKKEVDDLLGLENERFEEMTVISDLYIQRKDGNEEYYSIKTVKPNLDQVEKAKRDMLRLLAADTSNQVYFALPYNPSGDKKKYSEAGFTIPYKLFNMDEDECILIGSQFWNKVGGNSNTYRDLLKLFKSVGEKYSPIIREKYLKI